jgi:lipoprotein-anchoring transpeptidase ErfK/SrfK
MKRVEWGLVLALTLITILTLALVPPTTMELASAAPTPAVTATLAATVVASATPTRTASSTPSATSTMTLKPSATSTATRTATATRTPTPTATPYPFDTRRDLPRYIYVDQASQHMFIFERGELLRDIPCSTGLPQPDTYTAEWSGEVGRYVGTFFAFDVYADEAWYLYYTPEGSILIHSLPYLPQDVYKIYQDRDALGVRPASHGCIRIAPEDAIWFSAWNPEGVPITISDPYLDKWKSVLSK